MSIISKIKNILVGKPVDPISATSRQGMLLIAFYAWVGLGADGLSSANYGPQEAFHAILGHPSLALLLIIAIAFTIFIIAGGYNQVIELFPSGGGGYKVCSRIMHPYAGLISGVALIMDYVLTIAISTAAASDALFSLFPYIPEFLNIPIKIAFIAVLCAVNLRGTKESLKILLPIFLGFVITHVAILLLGLYAHWHTLPQMFHFAKADTHAAFAALGFWPALILLLKAYAMGAGTYTGLEAVSNNVNILAEPRVSTGKWTMFYMAASLSLMAGGILFMYLLWNVQPQGHLTYNAILFKSILHATGLPYHFALIVLMLFEVGILMLGANTGFLGGPAVLANMAADQWVPSQFKNLSSRLVKQNGILAFGIAAAIIILITKGHVSTLVVLYSITVFLAFALTLFSLVSYWWRLRRQISLRWCWKIIQASLGTFICVAILCVIVVEKFDQGAFLTLSILLILCFISWRIRVHYRRYRKKLLSIDRTLMIKSNQENSKPIEKKSGGATALIYVNEYPGLGMHTLLWIFRLFPGHFTDFIFVQAGMVDIESFKGEEELEEMQESVNQNLEYFVQTVESFGFTGQAVSTYGTTPISELVDITLPLAKTIPSLLCFATKVVFKKNDWISHFLHAGTATTLQNQLNQNGIKCLLLPMNLDT
jgi:amino acid transporter